MKSFCLAISLLFLLPAYPQAVKVKKIVWHNEALQSFFQHTKKPVPFLEFRMTPQLDIEFHPENTELLFNTLVIGNWYSASYAGHRYLFEKEYGELNAGILLNKLDSLRRGECYDNSFEGKIYPDHIDIKVTSNCPGKYPEGDRIFYKVKNDCSYSGGPAHFQQVISDRLACTNYRSYLNGDSAFFFYVLVKPDSISSRADRHGIERSPLDKLLEQSLTKLSGWLPYRKDGRNYTSYHQVFIYIRKDGTLIADYLR